MSLPKGALLTARHLETGWYTAQRRALPRGSHHNGVPLCTHHRDSKECCLPPANSTSRARKGWDSLYSFSTGWLQRKETYSPTILESRSPQRSCWQGHTPLRAAGKAPPWLFRPLGAPALPQPNSSICPLLPTAFLCPSSHDLPVCVCVWVCVCVCVWVWVWVCACVCVRDQISLSVRTPVILGTPLLTSC